MPNGYGMSRAGKKLTSGQRVVDELPPPGAGGPAIAAAATRAVQRLAAGRESSSSFRSPRPKTTRRVTGSSSRESRRASWCSSEPPFCWGAEASVVRRSGLRVCADAARPTPA